MCGWHRRNVCAGSGGAGEAIEIDGGWQWHVRGWAGLAERKKVPNGLFLLTSRKYVQRTDPIRERIIHPSIHRVTIHGLRRVRFVMTHGMGSASRAGRGDWSD